MNTVRHTLPAHLTAHTRPAARRFPAALTGLFLAGLSLTALTAGLAPASAAATTDSALAALLAAKSPAAARSAAVGVIVRTAAPLTPAQEAQLTALGAQIVCRLPIIQSVAVRLPQDRLAALAALPFAAHLSLDGAVQKTDEFTVGSSEASQAFVTTYDKKGKNPQTYKLTGAGVTVAVVDSGVSPVADLSTGHDDYFNLAPSRVSQSVNLSTPLPSGSVIGSLFDKKNSGKGNGKNVALSGLPLGVSSSNAADPCGHGTHVAGIIGGNGSRSPQAFPLSPLFSIPVCTHTFMGIAPDAGLVDVRVLDQDGGSTVSTVVSGLQWVLKHQKDDKKAPIRVVNLSLGHPVSESYTTDPICQAAEALWQAKIVVVCAAGNQGRTSGCTNTPGLDNEGWGTAYGSIQSPGNDPFVITVGATKSTDGNRSNDKIATYSSRGPSRLDLVMKPDIIAPGNKVISLDVQGSTLDNYAGGANDIPYSCYVIPSPTSQSRSATATPPITSGCRGLPWPLPSFPAQRR